MKLSPLSVRQATLDDLSAVSGILSEAALWFHDFLQHITSDFMPVGLDGLLSCQHTYADD